MLGFCTSFDGIRWQQYGIALARTLPRRTIPSPSDLLRQARGWLIDRPLCPCLCVLIFANHFWDCQSRAVCCRDVSMSAIPWLSSGGIHVCPRSTQRQRLKATVASISADLRRHSNPLPLIYLKNTFQGFYYWDPQALGQNCFRLRCSALASNGKGEPLCFAE